MPQAGPGVAGGDGVAGTDGDPITAAGIGAGVAGTTLGGDGQAMHGIHTIGTVAGIPQELNADRAAVISLTVVDGGLLRTQQADGVTSVADPRSRLDAAQTAVARTDEAISALEETDLRARLAMQTGLQETTETRATRGTETPIQTGISAKTTARLTTETAANRDSNVRSANLRAAAALTGVEVSAEVAADLAVEAVVDLAAADEADADKIIGIIVIFHRNSVKKYQRNKWILMKLQTNSQNNFLYLLDFT